MVKTDEKEDISLWGSEKDKDKQTERGVEHERRMGSTNPTTLSAPTVLIETCCVNQPSSLLSLFLTASLLLFIHLSLAAFALLIQLLCLSFTSSFTPDAHFLSLNYIWPLSCISRQQAKVSVPPPRTSISLHLSDSSCNFSPSLGFCASHPESIDGRAWLWFFYLFFFFCYLSVSLSFCGASCFSFSPSQSHSRCDCCHLLPSSLVLQFLLCSFLRYISP